MVPFLNCYAYTVAGAEGKVDESMELMKEVEDLKQKKRIAEVGREIINANFFHSRSTVPITVESRFLKLSIF